MRCGDFRNDVVLLLSGELAAEGKERLEAHLGTCAACAQYAGEVRRALDAVNAAHSAPQAVDLWPAVRARLGARRNISWQRWALAPVLGALLAGGVFVHVRYFSPQKEADMEIVKDLEFVTDYELWEDLETLEKADLPPVVRET